MIADERFYPKEFNLNFDSYVRHYERYFECLKLSEQIGIDQVWLDCACGSGYGTNFLSNFVKKIYGYDISKEAIEYAIKNYKNDKTDFFNNLDAIENNSIDLVLSVETIEHMPQNETNIFFTKLKKTLKKDGKLIITTPIVEKTNTNPKNKFHFIEYSDIDFVELLKINNFMVEKNKFILTKFTDGEEKYQGYYKCRKIN